MSDAHPPALTHVSDGLPPVALLAAERLPASPWLLGAALSAGLLAIELVASLVTPPAERIPFSWFRTLSLPLLSGYAAIATCGIAGASARSLRALAPSLELGSEECERLGRGLRRLSLRAHALSVSAGVLFPVAVGASLPDLRRAALSAHPQTLAYWVMASVFWWMVAQAVAMLLSEGRAFRKIGREGVHVDLFRPDALAPFGRFAVQSALFVCGALALAVLLAATPGANRSWLPQLEIARGVGALAVLFAASAGCALLALALPLLGIRTRIRAEKERLVQQLETALPRDHADAAALEGAALRAAGLLTLRDHVEAVAEWPVDAGMRRRFGLYALLPIASWLAKALLEQSLGWIIG